MAGQGIGLGISAVNSATARLQNISNEVFNKEVNNLFASYHTANGDCASQNDYNRDDWQRVGVKKRWDAEELAKSAQEQGLKAVVVQSKMNGEYLVEIQKTAEVPVAGSTETSTVSASEIISQYQAETGIDVDNSTDRQDVDESRMNRTLSNEVKNGIAGEFDYLGRAIVAVDNTLNFFSNYSTEKNDTNSMLNGTTNEDAGRSLQTATIINGDTVMVNGQVCTDEKICDYVHKQYEERIEKVDKVIDKYEEKRDKYYEKQEEKLQNGEISEIKEYQGSKRDETRYANAQAIKNSLYTQDFDLPIAKIDNNDRLDNALKQLNSTGVVLSTKADIALNDKERAYLSEIGALNGLSEDNLDLIKKVSTDTYKTGVERLSVYEREDLNNLISQKMFLDKKEYKNTKTQLSNDIKSATIQMEKNNQYLKTIEKNKTSLQAEYKDLSEKIDYVKFKDKSHSNEEREKQLEELINQRNKIKGKIDAYDKSLNKIKAENKKFETDIADNKKKLESLDKKHQDQVENGRRIRNRLALSEQEKKMFANGVSEETLNNLKRDFKNIGINGNTFTAQNLLDMNKELLRRTEAINAKNCGVTIQLTKKNAKGESVFDTETLKNLSKSQLELLGISESTRDFLVKMNGKNGKLWEQPERKSTGLLNKFGQKALQLVGDEDLSKMINTTTKVVNYTKSTITSARQFSATLKNKIQVKKAQIQAKKAANPNYKPKKAKERKVNQKKVERKLKADAKRNARTMKKAERMRKRKERIDKSLYGRIRNRYDGLVAKIGSSRLMQAMQRLKQKLMKLLIHVLKYVVIGIAIFAGIIAVVAVVFCIIEAIANFCKGLLQLIDPAYYKDSIAVSVGKRLENKEDEWIGSLKADYVGSGNVSNFKERKNKYYGSMAKNYENYIKLFDGEILDNGTMYINPFYTEDGLVTTTNKNKGALTEVKNFDGYNTVTIGANNNASSAKNQADGAIKNMISAESGHTSNIKDILSMIDVMCDSEYSTGEDGAIADVLNITPDEINGGCRTTNILTGLGKNLWEGLCWLFSFGTHEADFWTLNETFNGKTYGFIQDYADNLFDLSHQSTMALTVNYYPVVEEGGLKVKYTDNGGNEQEIIAKNMGQKGASKLGVCIEPITNKFEIMYRSNGDIFPCLEEENGTIHDLSDENEGFKVQIHIENAENPDDLCLWDSMGYNYETYVAIKDKHKDCWKKVAASSSVETIDGISVSGTSTESQGKAYAAAMAAAQEKINELKEKFEKEKQDSKNYFLSATHNTFKATLYNPDKIKTGTAQVTTKTHDEDYIEHASDCKQSSGGKCSSSCKKKKRTVTDSYTVTIPITYEKEIDYRQRECKGHNFKYCGGHVGLEAQGVVYSTTNEQLGICGTYDYDDVFPIVSDFDYEKYGYQRIYGKHNPKNIKLGADGKPLNGFQTAITEAKAQYGANDHPQGSLAGEWGLNVNASGMDESTGQLTKKALTLKNINDLSNNVRNLHDIFDVDCCILKGLSCFPSMKEWWTKYDGWSEDNMSLVAEKVSRDWRGTYNTDFVYECGGQLPLSTTDDVNTIIDALKEQYGEKFTQEREYAIKNVLYYVGRLHYSDEHSEHALLSKLCPVENHSFDNAKNKTNPDTGEKWVSNAFDKNCTAGNSKDFVNFIIQRSKYDKFVETDSARKKFEEEEEKRKKEFLENGGKEEDYKPQKYKGEPYTPTTIDIIDTVSAGTWKTYTGCDDLLPADIIMHEAIPEDEKSDLTDIPLTDDAINSLSNDYAFDDYITSLQDERYVIYIGTFDKDIELLGDRSSKEDENSSDTSSSNTSSDTSNTSAEKEDADTNTIVEPTIKAGVPVFVDLQKIHNCGNVYMHTEPYTTVEEKNDEVTCNTESNKDKNSYHNVSRKAAYVWLVENIDNRTKFLSFSTFN